MHRAAILGATGPTGWHLARELASDGTAVRVVSRSPENLAVCFPEPCFERVVADARDASATLRAVDGCDVTFDCLGFPMDAMGDHPASARSIAAATRASGARCVQVSSFWSYLPARRLPLAEDHPRAGGPLASRMRREAEDVLQQAGAAIVHLPDFFGPRVHASTLQQALREVLAAGRVSWIGGLDTPRDYVYVPDAMKCVVRLAQRPEAYGERWMFRGSGPLTGGEFAKLLSELLGRPVRARAAGVAMLRFLGLFIRELRAFSPMVPHYAAAIAYDASRAEALLGGLPATPYREAIGSTLDWMRAAGKAQAT